MKGNGEHKRSAMGNCGRSTQVSGQLAISRRTFLKGAGAAVFLGGAAPAFIRHAGASQLRPIKGTLPWLPVGGFSYWFAAKKLGYWEKRGLDVKIDRGTGSGDAAKNVGLGHYEFGESSYGVVINSIGKEMEIICVGAKLQRTPMAIISLKGSGIKKAKDIEGKKVATAVGGGNYQLWPGLIKATGIDEKKVELVLVSPPLVFQVLAEKKVDAITDYMVSTGGALVGHGFQLEVIMYSDMGMPMLDLGLIAQRKLVKSEPKLCQDFVDGAMDGLRHMLLEPEKTLEIHLEAVKEYAGAPQNREVLKSQMGITAALSLGKTVEEKGLGWIGEQDMKSTVDLVVKYMGLEKMPDMPDIYTNQFAGKVKLSAADWNKVRQNYTKYIKLMGIG